MARRGRGTAARTKVAPGGRDDAVDGSYLPGDEPGARTIGAMALKRWVARGPGRGDTGDDGGDVVPTHGPFDEEDAGHDPFVVERIDFGAVRLPVPHGGEVSVEPEDGRLQAVHVMLPAGRLSVSALAAPRTERLWPDLAAEIDESLREGGATVRSFTGEWGRELHARTGDASSLFVGVDGPRWMLYGVATGPTSAAAELDVALRTMLRGTVVVRGRSPYPVRTVLPLTIPDRLPLPAPHAGPERVPVPRMPAERLALPSRPAPTVDAPTTITTVTDSLDTVPHGIPRSIPGATGRDAVIRPPHPGGPATAEPPAARSDPGPRTPELDAEPEVSRTASRGLFRRRPAPERSERPSGRPAQRRVADLVAQAERDRATADRAGAPAPRPGRSTGPDESARPAPAAAERPAPDGHRGRTNGFVPRELTSDHSATNGTTVDAGGHDVAGRNGRSSYDRSTTNGVGYAPGHGAPFDRPYVNGSSLDERPSNGSYGSGSYGDFGFAGHEPSDLVWNGVEPAGGSYATEPAPGGSRPDEWSHDDRTVRDDPGTGFRDDVAPDDYWLEAPGGSVGAIEATVWASMAGGGGRSAEIAADGSDDWTLPLPVVRPAPPPEPEPVRPGPLAAAPGGRRARREAAEREAQAREAAAGRRAGGHREPEWSPSGAHSPDRPRHAGGQHERDAAVDGRTFRDAGRRTRHSEEHGDPRGRDERARHRRPDH